MNQTISAARALQMSDALKQGPCTVEELAALAGLQETTTERWISQMQVFGRVRTGSADGLGWYRWVTATDQQVIEFAAMYDAARDAARRGGGLRR
jgi:DNA-binding IclR family transcriptional regulator